MVEMKLDKKAIETISVNAVRDCIVMTGYLDQFISDNDKEPSWDGHIYVYNSKTKRKNELKGRIPVQVKGKECDDFSKSIIMYSMSETDLKNYLNDGGVILFVVYIRNNGNKKKIYYAELPPIKLRLILENLNGKKSKSIELKNFPNDNNAKVNICLNCLQHCKMQASFANGKLYSINDFKNQNLLEGISIPFSYVSTTDVQSVIVNSDAYIYANIKGCSIPQPLKDIPTDLHIIEEENANISINGKQYYSQYNIIKGVNDTTIRLGKSFEMRFIESEKRCKIKYSNSANLRTLVQDLDFILPCLEQGYFKINNITIPIHTDAVDLNKFDISTQKKNLEYYKKIINLFNVLGYTGDINLDTLNNSDWRNLYTLITALIDKQPVRGLKDNLSPIQNFNVGKLNFLLYINQHEDDKNIYDIYDFFKIELPMIYGDNNKNELPISQYAILDKDCFLNINNIDFDVLLPSFQKVERHNDVINRANFFLLELLSAYDASHNTRKDILKTAYEFAEWIAQSSEEELCWQIKKINLLQTIKRERELTKEEQKELYLITESNCSREDYLVAAYLLLNQQTAAEIHFDKLSFDQQEEFKKYPIYHFWN